MISPTNDPRAFHADPAGAYFHHARTNTVRTRADHMASPYARDCVTAVTPMPYCQDHDIFACPFHTRNTQND